MLTEEWFYCASGIARRATLREVHCMADREGNYTLAYRISIGKIQTRDFGTAEAARAFLKAHKFTKGTQ